MVYLFPVQPANQAIQVQRIRCSHKAMSCQLWGNQAFGSSCSKLELVEIVACDHWQDTESTRWCLVDNSPTQRHCWFDLCTKHFFVTGYLEIIIQEYLESRKCLFPETTLKPKHHFMRHYPVLILKFGPLIRVWTMRFESKHSYFKRCARHLKKL